MFRLFSKTRANMLKRKHFLKYILYALGEISLIVIGILLALYLQNRNEQKKTIETINVSVNMLKDEISTNMENINGVKDYHIMVKDTLLKLEPPKTEEEAKDALGYWRGMRTPRLQNAAFQTVIQSGISKELKPELLKTLNSLYAYQDSYNDFTSQSTQIFLNADFTDLKAFGRIMGSIQITMTDLYYYERELTESYEYCLKQIDSIYR